MLRLQAFRDRLPTLAFSPYQVEIMTQACRDLLQPSPVPAASELAPPLQLHANTLEEISRLSDRDLPRYLFYRYRYEIFPQIYRLDDFPPCLQVEPTSICNYRCVFCYQTDATFSHPQQGHMGMMSLDLFRQVIDQAAGNCEALTLASRGEPLLHPEIELMLAYTADKFLALKLNTNASLLDERKAHAILQAGVNTVVFSVDAAAEPLYSQLRVHGKLERVVANIRQFQEIRTRHYPESTTITRVSGVKFQADQDLDTMEDFWADWVDQVAFVSYNPWENTYQQPVNQVTTPCSDLWRRMFVWFDGTVNPCDVDYKSTLRLGKAGGDLPQGNPSMNRLSQLWTGEDYQRLRTAHLSHQRQVAAPCNRCSVV